MALPIWLFITGVGDQVGDRSGRAAHRGRVHRLAGAQSCGPHAESLGTHAGRPVWPAAAAADGLKFLFKEDLTPPHVYKPLFIAAPLIAVIFALTSIAVIPFGNCGHHRRLQHSAADHRREHWTAADSRRDFDWRLRRRACGMVVEQQVFAARRTARQRADGELRNFARAFRWWAC